MTALEQQIDELWGRREELVGNADARELVISVIARLDRGEIRVAELVDDEVVVHEWVKKAILLMFSLSAMKVTEVGPFEWVDKIPLKRDYSARGVRAVPPATARFGAFIDEGAILMPSYVNIGARVGARTMVDTWATVGSCAQIGANVHLSGGVGIGGVLEPPQAAPVFIEDDCMIGSRSMVTQGARVKRGAVLGEGVILNPGIPVIDSQTGEEVGRGVVPPYSICVQAGRKREFPGGEFMLPCVLVLRRYEPGERTHLNSILREHGVNVG
ncbi:MAG: 2,3,4,5-tetrahydropyridine-2,6-dicarboxylate N-succinyltransferase [Acidimicrobiaceae bacterium]|jgi:2,3,4,5-tetrahydropyridine-2-carboxylate N-succinyltransferase